MGTITKALTLLNLFSANRTEMGLAEIVRLSGRDKATVHRHLVELQENGFLEQHPVTFSCRRASAGSACHGPAHRRWLRAACGSPDG